MATDFTAHYHLDKYVATDKPNLRDQYNAAMDKIDLALLSANTNATEAKATVLTFDEDLSDLQDALPLSAFSQSTVQQALNGKASTSALSAEATARESAITAEATARESAITAEATARQNADTALSAADTALGNRIDTLNTTVNGILAKKKMIVIGDSFSSEAQTGSPLWYTYVAKKYNLDVYTTASDGQGFVVGQNNFQTQLNNAITNVPASQVERVFVLGGLNDTRASSWDLDTFSTAVANLFGNIRNAYPNAIVEVYGPESFPNILENNAIASAYMAYFAGDNGFEYHDMSVPFQFCNNFFGGKTGSNEHPSSRGSRQIAAFVLSHGVFSTGNFVIANIFPSAQVPTVLDNNNEVLPNVIARQGAFYSNGTFKYFIDLNLANVPATVSQIKIRSPYRVSDYFHANMGGGLGANDYCDVYLSKIPTNAVASGWCDIAQHSINFSVNGTTPIQTGSGTGRVVFTGLCR